MPLVTPSQIQAAAAEEYRNRGRRGRWRVSPVDWALDHDLELWSGQVRILDAVARHDRVAIRSSHDTGKSYAMAALAGWWLDVHEQGTARVVTTAPTGDQVRGVLWVEINAMWTKLGLSGRRNQSEIWFGDYQAAVGRKSSDYNPAAFSGWHAPNLLVIVDEADGVSAQLWGAIDTLATNAGAKIVGIGNPDDPQSEFRRRQSDQPFGGKYHTIRISAWDTPNYTGESVSPFLSKVLLSPAWVEEMRLAWGGDPGSDRGPDHPFWQSKVEAEYPDESANAVIRLSDLLRARNNERTDRLAAWDDRQPTQVGIDVAGSDLGDESVIRAVKGFRLLDQVSARISDPEELEDWIMDHLDLFDARRAAIDADGIGFGFAGAIRRRRSGRVSVMAVRSSAKADNLKAYVNRRAEMWWQLRDALATGQLDFTRLDDATAGQLLMPRYSTVKGRIQVESKNELRKRLGRSPDMADALVYCLAKDRVGGTMTLSRPKGLLPRA